jgi:hypothetical protein
MKNQFLLQQMAAEVMAANEFQRGYNAFSGVNMKTKLELDPEVAKAARPWMEKVMREAFKYLQTRAETEIPGMKAKDAKRRLDYTLATLIKCWAESEAARIPYSMMLDSFDSKERAPVVKDGAYSAIGELLVEPIKRVMDFYRNVPLNCSICGKEKCAHLQTLLADDKDTEVIDAVFQDAQLQDNSDEGSSLFNGDLNGK